MVQLTFCQILHGQGKLCEMRLTPSDAFAFWSSVAEGQDPMASTTLAWSEDQYSLWTGHTKVHLSSI